MPALHLLQPSQFGAPFSFTLCNLFLAFFGWLRGKNKTMASHPSFSMPLAAQRHFASSSNGFLRQPYKTQAEMVPWALCCCCQQGWWQSGWVLWDKLWEVAPVVMERGSEANSKLHCPVKVWAGLGAFRLNAGAEVSQKENCSFFFCNYHPNACLLISSLLPSSTEEGFCAGACLGEWGRLSANSTAGSIWFLSGQEQKTPLDGSWAASPFWCRGARRAQGPSAWMPRCFHCWLLASFPQARSQSGAVPKCRHFETAFGVAASAPAVQMGGKSPRSMW